MKQSIHRVTAVNKAFLKEAVKILKSGGVIIFPTDTSYGLGADATNAASVKKIYQIKGRNFNKPISIMVSSPTQLDKIARVTADTRKLIKNFWPGPLTVILKRKPGLARNLNPNDQTIAVRFPKNKIANQLCRKLGCPITATSANLSGQGNIYSADKIINIFKNRVQKPDAIINAKTLPLTKPSTIIDLTAKPYRIIRKGPIIKAQIKKILNPWANRSGNQWF